MLGGLWWDFARVSVDHVGMAIYVLLRWRPELRGSVRPRPALGWWHLVGYACQDGRQPVQGSCFRAVPTCICAVLNKWPRLGVRGVSMGEGGGGTVWQLANPIPPRETERRTEECTRGDGVGFLSAD